MSIIVSQSLASSHPIDHNAVKAVGITLPIVNSRTGYFQQSYTTADAIRTDLINLLLTNKGERPMVPLFGSDLKKALFDPNDDQIQVSIDYTIRLTVQQYMPFVIIDDVRVIKENTDIYTAKVLLTYHVPDIVGLSDLAFFVST